MANTYFQMDTTSFNFPTSASRIDLTAFVDSSDGGLQVSVGRSYVILTRNQALTLAQAIIARYTGITATGDELFVHPLNKLSEDIKNE